MASIRDVAKLAQVAPSTVSLVLNNTGYVSDATRLKVRQAMEELRYVPNELARNLYKKRTNMIGVIVPDLSHPFFSTFVGFVEAALYERGYMTMVCSTVQKKNSEKEFLDRLQRRMIDGVIMGAHSLTVDAYAADCPIVALDRYLNERVPIIRSDHRQGGRVAAERFLVRGCRHVVQAMGARQVTTPAHEHHFAFEEVMRAGGAHVETMEMGWNQFGPEYFQSVAMQLLDRFPDADGIFGSDLLICACLQQAQHAGIHVPEQLKMIAYDGTFITRMNAKTLTAVVQPIDLLARRAAECVVALINGASVPVWEPLAVSLQDGETC